MYQVRERELLDDVLLRLGGGGLHSPRFVCIVAIGEAATCGTVGITMGHPRRLGSVARRLATGTFVWLAVSLAEVGRSLPVERALRRLVGRFLAFACSAAGTAGMYRRHQFFSAHDGQLGHLNLLLRAGVLALVSINKRVS
jgi:hypothetical protein